MVVLPDAEDGYLPTIREQTMPAGPSAVRTTSNRGWLVAIVVRGESPEMEEPVKPD